MAPLKPVRFLVVNPELPQFDRTSGGLRLFSLLGLLSDAGVSCDYLVTTPTAECAKVGEVDYLRYQNCLTEIGVRPLTAPIRSVLRSQQYDVVLFEFFHVAQQFTKLTRLLQPHAQIITDSVDLSFLRWHAKANLSNLDADRDHALSIEAAELAAYRNSDLVLTLTGEESRELSTRLPKVRLFEIPNIHEIRTRSNGERSCPSLLFIGSFTHEPNVDAVRWFAGDIWSQVRARFPDARWVIVGADAPADIAGMNGNGIEFKGRVHDTKPFLDETWVSVAPLRFGAGMKGKVGEALSCGVPVVTTAFGAQGYGVVDRVSIALGNDAKAFASGVCWLLEDAHRRRSIGQAGQSAIRNQFSREAIAKSIPHLLTAIRDLPPRRGVGLLMLLRAKLRLEDIWKAHVSWRF